MPSITKAEYQSLKDQIKLLELKLQYEKLISEYITKALRDQQHEAEKWKRYYDAVRETFKVEDTIEVPGYFHPMDTVKYIVKKQEEKPLSDELKKLLPNLPSQEEFKGYCDTLKWYTDVSKEK